jgi:ribosomal protein S18 acetylase RimI-like enzyme
MRKDAGRQVRAASVEDAESIAAIHVASRRIAYTGLIPAASLSKMSVEEFGTRWKARLNAASSLKQWTWLIEEDGSMRGFSSTGFCRDADMDPAEMAEIYALYVEPVAWGRGLGRALTEWSLNHLRARQYKAVVLWVLSGNVAARRFYERIGFQPDGAVKVKRSGQVELPELRYRVEF